MSIGNKDKKDSIASHYILRFIDNESGKIEFLTKHHKKITMIINKAFHPNCKSVPNHSVDDLMQILRGTVCVCVIICTDNDSMDEKIIGICSCTKSTFFTSTDDKNKLDSYNCLRYLQISNPGNQESDSLAKDKNKNCVFDHQNKMIINLNPVEIPIDICGLCKDDQYKDVGKFMLSGIAAHYKALGFHEIYLSAESRNHWYQVEVLQLHTHRVEILGETKMAEMAGELYLQYLFKINKILNANLWYQIDQIALCRYYETQGFKLMKNTYDLLSSGNIISLGIRPVVFVKTYVMRLDD